MPWLSSYVGETDNRKLTQQDGLNTKDGRMMKKCRVRLGMHSLALLFFVILPSWVFQPSCCVSSLLNNHRTARTDAALGQNLILIVLFYSHIAVNIALSHIAVNIAFPYRSMIVRPWVVPTPSPCGLDTTRTSRVCMKKVYETQPLCFEMSKKQDTLTTVLTRPITAVPFAV